MLSNPNDWPADPALRNVFPSLSPDSMLGIFREQRDVPEGIRQDWIYCRVIEALYDPGDHILIAYALHNIPDAPRDWPDGDIVYVRCPARPSRSRRGQVLSIRAVDVEVFRFPYDRRLRGLRRFCKRQPAAAVWQRWLDQDESSLQLQPETLRRDLIRYVPEQKWIAHFYADCWDALSDQTVKRSIAVRASDVPAGQRMYQNVLTLRRHRENRADAFRIPRPVAFDDKLGLLASRWVWGDSLLDMLRSGDVDEIMDAVARGLSALHDTPMPDMSVEPCAATDQLLTSAVRCAEDVCLVLPETKPHLNAIQSRLDRNRPSEERSQIALIHNDFHFKQLRGRPDRLTLLDYERVCPGNPWSDVGSFAAQLLMLPHRPTMNVTAKQARCWHSAFLHAWETVTGASADVHRLQWYGALTMLTLARGAVRHLWSDWPTLVRHCLETADEFTRQRDVVETPA